ncbi:hypothetical protein ONE63_003422 [Megalurothrips usitatus]|uniref:acid phosphatase n=1 Tax=Megalurothrips usitatus TaxID=439358 RepID=A0AAV7XB95_9NEOP|nr:hypothetical protein ONE63_003422 [Megalurothrips usitatus]
MAYALLAVICVVIGTSVSSSVPNTTLLNVQLLFRHGARTPTQPYPTDPHLNDTYMPYGLGHLTQLGREMAYMLGRYIRQRYVVGEDGSAPASGFRLVEPEYRQGALLVNTSAVSRTQETAQAVLAGLFYPPGDSQQWRAAGSGLGQRWIPISYNVLPVNTDRALIGSAPCSARDQEVMELYNSTAYKRQLERAVGNSSNLRYIQEHAGLSDADLTSQGLYFLYSDLRCQEDLNITLPSWARQRGVYPDLLSVAADVVVESLSTSSDLRRLTWGDLTSGIIYVAKNHGSQPRMCLYSGHDTTVESAIKSFGLETEDPAGNGLPEFTACLFFELHKDSNGTLGMQFFYRREAGGPLVRMIPKGCGPFCRLDKMEALLVAKRELPLPTDNCTVHPDLEGSLVNHHLHHVTTHGRRPYRRPRERKST